MIKKLLLGVFAFSLLIITNQAHASTTVDNGCYGTAAYSITTGHRCTTGTVLGATTDTTPRIAYWYGKVNQHVDANGVWTTDPDGSSGANLDKLTYCKKWYPNTTSVQDYQSESINTWQNAGNTGGPFTATVTSTQCVSTSTTPTSTPSITIISPNGGETYTAGQQITVTWNSSNIPADATVMISTDHNGAVFDGGETSINVKNTGTSLYTLPSSQLISNYGYSTGKNFQIEIIYVNNSTNIADQSDNLFTIQAPTTLDTTPRIAYWYGKVNQHVDTQGNWMTDPDGRSGADLDKLTYCKKWYPNTLSVQDYKSESINTWQNAGNTADRLLLVS